MNPGERLSSWLVSGRSSHLTSGLKVNQVSGATLHCSSKFDLWNYRDGRLQLSEEEKVQMKALNTSHLFLSEDTKDHLWTNRGPVEINTFPLRSVLTECGRGVKERWDRVQTGDRSRSVQGPAGLQLLLEGLLLTSNRPLKSSPLWIAETRPLSNRNRGVRHLTSLPGQSDTEWHVLQLAVTRLTFSQDWVSLTEFQSSAGLCFSHRCLFEATSYQLQRALLMLLSV